SAATTVPTAVWFSATVNDPADVIPGVRSLTSARLTVRSWVENSVPSEAFTVTAKLCCPASYSGAAANDSAPVSASIVKRAASAPPAIEQLTLLLAAAPRPWDAHNLPTPR